jgi:hypothetical protein
MHAIACVATRIRSVTSPPSRTRSTSLLTGDATQIAPSASRQIPSGIAFSSCAQTRRFESEPSSAMSNAERRAPNDSPRSACGRRV